MLQMGKECLKNSGDLDQGLGLLLGNEGSYVQFSRCPRQSNKPQNFIRLMLPIL